MKSYSVVLRVEKIYEVEANTEASAIRQARTRMRDGVMPDAEEEADEPTAIEMGE